MKFNIKMLSTFKSKMTIDNLQGKGSYGRKTRQVQMALNFSFEIFMTMMVIVNIQQYAKKS